MSNRPIPRSSSVAAAKERYKQETSNATFRYPGDMGEHAIVFNFKKYNFQDTFETGRSVYNPRTSVILPLPANLMDNMNVEVRNYELGWQGRGSVGFVSAIKNNGLSDTVGQAGSFANALGATTGDIIGTTTRQGTTGMAQDMTRAASIIARTSLGRALPGGSTAYDVASGGMLNPHVTLTFNGVNLKKHTFEWTFAPRNADESEKIRLIIRELKQKALPSYMRSQAMTNSNTSFGAEKFYLNYPHIADIYFIGLAQAYFWEFKPCMIENIMVEYSHGGLAIVEGGKPAIVKLQLQLSEMAIHTAEDYGGETGSINDIEPVPEI